MTLKRLDFWADGNNSAGCYSLQTCFQKSQHHGHVSSHLCGSVRLLLNIEFPRSSPHYSPLPSQMWGMCIYQGLFEGLVLPLEYTPLHGWGEGPSAGPPRCRARVMPSLTQGFLTTAHGLRHGLSVLTLFSFPRKITIS